MMQHASAGVRNAARKGSNTLLHHGGHNGPGGGTTANQFHTANFIQSTLHAPHVPSVPSRNPSHKLFSASKNFLQRFFTHLTAPGWRAPPYLTQTRDYSSRSLHGTTLRGATIQSGLSLPVRNSLRNHALQRQANAFLPRGPPSAPPRCGGVTQVGLGTARNFSTARPIFEHLIQNVPVAARALYEIELDLGSNKHSKRMLPKVTIKDSKKAHKSKRLSQDLLRHVIAVEGESEDVKVPSGGVMQDDIDHYFPNVVTPLVTTYLSIPLAPTSPTRNPLPPDLVSLPTLSNQESGLLPPLSFLASLHSMHSIHSLRVATLFARLDQAAVWSRGGVLCSAYSEGFEHQRQDSKCQPEMVAAGVCTILKIEFRGWTQDEVRSVIGESGIGWYTMEEVVENSREDISETDSLCSSNLDNISLPEDDLHWGHYDGTTSPMFDPAESLVLPTVEISTNSVQTSLSPDVPGDALPNISLEMENDPWADEYPTSEFSSPYSSCSNLSDIVIDPPSINGWFGASPSSPPGLGERSPIYQSFVVLDNFS